MTTAAGVSTPGGGTLITSPTTKQLITTRRDVDARTALAKGLMDYIRGRELVVNGRAVTFRKLFSTYAEQEDEAVYPSAAITTDGPGTYDAAKFNAGINKGDAIPDVPEAYLLTSTDLVQNMTLEVWATSNAERAAVMLLLEEVLFPVEWMYGMRIAVPYYYGLHAEYLPLDSIYLDSAEDAKKRFRKVEITIEARIPIARVVTGIPTAHGRIIVDQTVTQARTARTGLPGPDGNEELIIVEPG